MNERTQEEIDALLLALADNIAESKTGSSAAVSRMIRDLGIPWLEQLQTVMDEADYSPNRQEMMATFCVATEKLMLWFLINIMIRTINDESHPQFINFIVDRVRDGLQESTSKFHTVLKARRAEKTPGESTH